MGVSLRDRFDWSDECKAIVRKRWEEGASSGLIAEEINAPTRNTVMGMINRMGLTRRDQPQRQDTRANADRSATQRVRARARVKDVIVEASNFPDEQADLRIPLKQRKTLLQLGNNNCHWPVGQPYNAGFFFCGAPGADVNEGRPYCAGHSKRARSGPSQPHQQRSNQRG